MRRLLPFFLLCACAHTATSFPIVPDARAITARDAWVQGAPLTAKRPLNVVLLVADDLGMSDVSMYGDTKVRTPGIDRIAKEGVAFTQGYVTAPICSPSRAALLTGRYQQRFGYEGLAHERYARGALEYFVYKNFLARGDWVLKRPVEPSEADVQRQGLPRAEVTLAEVLRRHGYATGAFGKWHLGWTEETVPHHRGFQQTYGFYEGYTLYQSDLKSPDVVTLHADRDFSDPFIWSKARTGTAAIRRNGVEVDAPGFLMDRLVDEALGFIDANKQQPFFVYLPFLAPHTPYQVKKSDYDALAQVKNEKERVYRALVKSLDDSVKRVLDGLDERGLAQDTLVVFLSDNGGVLYTDAVTNAPYQAGKLSHFEGGVRVPFALRLPGRVPAGTMFDAPVSSLDVFSTVLAAVGAEAPGDREYDGVDLVPFVRGEAVATPHDALYWRNENAQAVRSGDYKLVRDTSTGQTALFNLLSDPGETTDLTQSLPEVRARLEGKFEAWEATTRPPLWPHVMQYRTVTSDGREWWFPL